jgi:hypothetical protein
LVCVTRYTLLTIRCGSDEITESGDTRFRVMVFSATFNSISAISWRSVLLVEETGESHRPVMIHTINPTLYNSANHVEIGPINIFIVHPASV